MPTNNHPQLTARDILEAFQQVQREILEHDISAQEGTTRYEYRWERMSTLLNERMMREYDAMGKGYEKGDPAQ